MQESDFRYSLARLDGGKELIQEVCTAANDVHKALRVIDFRTVGVSEYNQRYLSTKFTNPIYEFSIVVYMLSYLLSKAKVPRENLTFVDYGAGSGIICLVAKALGIGTVIYSDIYDVSCTDAETIGRIIDLEADHYIAGEFDDVKQYMETKGLYCDMLASHDCLEHIYDVKAFLRSVPHLPTKSMAIWISSAANPLRPKTRRTLSKVALAAENEDRPNVWGHKERDALQSFLSIRREVVKKTGPQLDDIEVDTLARKTRGMKEDDIVQTVNEFLSSGQFPPDPEHPTNTCDPYTGNWAEQLMDPFQLAEFSDKERLHLDVKPGYWARESGNRIKNLAKTLSNVCMNYFGDYSLRLAPYYVLRGEFIAKPHR